MGSFRPDRRAVLKELPHGRGPARNVPHASAVCLISTDASPGGNPARVKRSPPSLDGQIWDRWVGTIEPGSSQSTLQTVERGYGLSHWEVGSPNAEI